MTIRLKNGQDLGQLLWNATYGWDISSRDELVERLVEVLEQNTLGGREQWGVYFEDYPEEADNETLPVRDETDARAIVAKSPTDRGLRRRVVTEWEQVN